MVYFSNRNVDTFAKAALVEYNQVVDLVFISFRMMFSTYIVELIC